jgi:imidazole glycerol-phosphate synthase subunit HisH
MITIIDCGINNLRSAQKAIEHLGYETLVTRDADVVSRADKILLPGVGAFGAAMQSLREANLVEPIQDAIKRGVPFLGVCLALQLLFDESEELGLNQGLGAVAGRVVRFAEVPGLKIPHMGWSPLHFPRETKLFKGVSEGEMVYFVHSYHALPQDKNIVAATSNHGQEFVAAIERDNLMACQFHPEKSSAVGLKILENFGNI